MFTFSPLLRSWISLHSATRLPSITVDFLSCVHIQSFAKKLDISPFGYTSTKHYCRLSFLCFTFSPLLRSWISLHSATRLPSITVDFLSCVHIQSFAKKLDISPFGYTSTKLLHCWFHKNLTFYIQINGCDIHSMVLCVYVYRYNFPAHGAKNVNDSFRIYI